MAESFSVYMQVYNQKRATFEVLKSFRTWYPKVPISMFSDAGEDFSAMAEAFEARYVPSDIRMGTGTPKRSGNTTTLEGSYEYFRRVHQHCLSVDTEWIVFLLGSTRTIRHIRSFPHTAIAGARMNPFSPELTDYLKRNFGDKPYVYGTAGGGIVKRQAWIDAYEGDRDLSKYVTYDPNVAQYADMAQGLLMYINHFDYSVWDEVSEIFHESAPIVRDSAFDHGYKYWYDREWDDRLLDEWKYRDR